MGNTGSVSFRHLREGEEDPVEKDLRRRFRNHECRETLTTIEITDHPEMTLRTWGCFYCIRIFMSEMLALAENTPKVRYCIGTHIKASSEQ